MIGKSVPRVDAYDKVTGRAKFTDDLVPANCLVAKIYHAKIGNGIVKSIDTSKAEALDGVVKVVTFKDVPNHCYPTPGHPWSVELAHQDVADRNILTGRVRYYGDDIAAVVAEDEITAQRALRLIEVEYEEYPVEIHPRKSMYGSKPPIHLDKKDNVLYIPYFQANTNTYAPLERLKALYEEALSFEGAVGLAVSTRPDCITDEAADYLAELSKRTYLTVELGLQTIHDVTAKKINRCHTYADFLDGYEKLHSRGINVCVHIINGLPDETHHMMLETAKAVSKLDIHSIKIHLLHIIKGTVIAEQYENGEFDAMTFDDYISTVCDQIELLPPEVIIQRVTGDGDRETLIAPRWSLDKKSVMNGIDKEMAWRNTVQGAKFIPQ